jgi:type I site-specific restriction endonuclease
MQQALEYAEILDVPFAYSSNGDSFLEHDRTASGSDPTHSLKQGIADGFLAPYRVIRVGIDKDLDGWRPYDGQTDKHG